MYGSITWPDLYACAHEVFAVGAPTQQVRSAEDRRGRPITGEVGVSARVRPYDSDLGELSGVQRQQVLRTR